MQKLAKYKTFHSNYENFKLIYSSARFSVFIVVKMGHGYTLTNDQISDFLLKFYSKFGISLGLCLGTHCHLPRDPNQEQRDLFPVASVTPARG